MFHHAFGKCELIYQILNLYLLYIYLLHSLNTSLSLKKHLCTVIKTSILSEVCCYITL